MSEELKPVRCGCGGEAHVGKVYRALPLHKVRCVNCGIETMYKVHCVNCGMETAAKSTETEAIEAWNKVMSGISQFPCTNIGKERIAKVEMLLCGNCYESNIFDAVTRKHYKYCPSCGARLEWDE